MLSLHWQSSGVEERRRGATADSSAAINGCTVLRGHPGVVYNASTTSGKRLLISFDSGICAVSTYTDDALLIESLILLNADASGAVVVNHLTKAAPDGKILFHFDTLHLQGAYPIIGFVDFTTADQLTAPHQLDITAGNVNLRP